jgi:hypothetical protein
MPEAQFWLGFQPTSISKRLNFLAVDPHPFVVRYRTMNGAANLGVAPFARLRTGFDTSGRTGFSEVYPDSSGLAPG